jgi:site-specific DNA-methyltransferase (adenine-specific)
MDTNLLYYGDNLSILRKDIPDNSVDLIYLDPPFNSSRGYNIIFKDESGRGTDASTVAFDDTWHWGPRAEEHYNYLTITGANDLKVGEPLGRLIAALRSALGVNEMTAYLVEMAVRLVELHRVLKTTGSLYLHCDPTASSYLRVLLDAIFDPLNFRSEITWQRTNIHNDSKSWSAVADILLYYVKDARQPFVWNSPRGAYGDEYLKTKYRYKDADGRVYRLDNMTSPNPRPNMMYEWRGHTSPPFGWRYELTTMERLDLEGRIWYPKKKTQRPQLKRYLDEMSGPVISNIWTDIDPINSQARERLGYPTQKPLALLKRILAASSDEGDVVLDPFCGCGTALVAAEDMKRLWIGIDITYLSINVMQQRLADACQLKEVPVRGAPTEVEGARQLAQSLPNGRYQFQFWALSKIGAGPVGGKEKKGMDRGIDGVILFPEPMGERQQILVSVKSGGVTSHMVRDLVGVLKREGAAMGIFLTLEEPTAEMKLEAVTAGFFHSKLADKNYPKLQIITVRELLDKRLPDLPPLLLPAYQSATKAKDIVGQVQDLFGT